MQLPVISYAAASTSGRFRLIKTVGTVAVILVAAGVLCLVGLLCADLYRLHNGRSFRDSLRPVLASDARFRGVVAGLSTSGDVLVQGHVAGEAEALALYDVVSGARPSRVEVTWTIVVDDGRTNFRTLVEEKRPPDSR